MVKTIFAFMTLVLLTGQAFAVINFTCTGSHYYTPVVIYGSIPNATAFGSTTGTVHVDGREVTSFSKGQMKVSLLFQTFKAKNNQGDFLNGEVLSFKNQTAKIDHLYVQAYGIDYKNVALNCR